MLTQHLLENAARAQPGAVALIVGDQEIRFEDLDVRSTELAAGLIALGVAPGDRVATLLENSIDMAVAMWAAWKAGAIFTPINHAARASALAFILRDAEVKVLIAQPSYAGRLKEAGLDQEPGFELIWTQPYEVGRSLRNVSQPADAYRAPALTPQDLALLIYTSGSTGEPKGVVMAHETVCNNAQSIAEYLKPCTDDKVLCVLPLSFGYGLYQLLTAAIAGHCVVLANGFAFPQDVLNALVKHRITGLPAVPTIFAKLIGLIESQAPDLSHLRYVTNAAAPLPIAHIEKLRAVLPNVRIYSMYGLTECTRVSFLEPALVGAKPGSVGRAMPNCEALVVDEEGRVCPPDVPGELVIRGANLMRGYWNRPSETARVLHLDREGRTVLHTGDVFYRDAEGDLFFVGRLDDVFKCRGEKVSPREVESALYELDQVAEAAVVGVPDDADGMAVKAFVVLEEGAVMTEADIRRHCRARLAPTLNPKFIEFRTALPKTDTGKIARKPLRQSAFG